MVVDIIILIVILVFLMIDRKRGLALSILSIFSIVISIALSLALYEPVENYLKNNTKMEAQISNSIKKDLEKQNENKQEDNENATNEVENSVESNDEKTAKNGKTGNAIISIQGNLEGYINQEKEKIETTKEAAIDKATTDITENVMKAVSFIIVYILVTIILLVLKLVIKIFTKIPGISSIDRFGGGIIGIIEGALIVYIVISIISIIQPSPNNGEPAQTIDSSYVGSYIYENNVLRKNILKK